MNFCPRSSVTICEAGQRLSVAANRVHSLKPSEGEDNTTFVGFADGDGSGSEPEQEDLIVDALKTACEAADDIEDMLAAVEVIKGDLDVAETLPEDAAAQGAINDDSRVSRGLQRVHFDDRNAAHEREMLCSMRADQDAESKL